jgi:hypothetical protein
VIAMNALLEAMRGRSNTNGVVPANAGIHNHRLLMLREKATPTSLIVPRRRLGPGVRRDDSWGADRTEGLMLAELAG